MTGEPQQVDQARVLFHLLEAAVALVNERVPRGRRREPVHRNDVLPDLELIGGYLWVYGLPVPEPSVEVVDALIADGLMLREVSYSVPIEREDAADAAWWLEAAEEQGEIPRVCAQRWAQDDARQAREAGSDAESE